MKKSAVPTKQNTTKYIASSYASSKSQKTASTVKASATTRGIADAKFRAISNSNGKQDGLAGKGTGTIYSNKEKNTIRDTLKTGGTLTASACYVDLQKPVGDRSGLFSGNQSVGIAEFKGQNKSATFEWQFNAVSASAKAGVGSRYTGIDMTASLFSGGIGGKLPGGAYLGISGYAGGVSKSSQQVYENGRVTHNISFPYGFGISITYGPK